jgi:hypothetical protein
MINRTSLTTTQRHQLSGSLVVLLAMYVLGLCGQCSFVSADFFRQRVSEPHASAAHCLPPSAVPHPAHRAPGDTDPSSQPGCCELMNANKALTSSALPTILSPALSMSLVAQAGEAPIHGISFPFLVHRPHDSHPPPLYRLHATLLL